MARSRVAFIFCQSSAPTGQGVDENACLADLCGIHGMNSINLTMYTRQSALQL